MSSIEGRAIKVSCGENHTGVLALGNDSVHDNSPLLWLFGSNEFGQLGLPLPNGESETEMKRKYLHPTAHTPLR